MKRLKSIAIFLLLLTCFSCNKSEPIPHIDEYNKVLVICSLGYNNLSGDLRGNLNTLLNNPLPKQYRDMAIVAYCHNTNEDRTEYITKVSPVLVQLYSENGIGKLDTLKIYAEDSISATQDCLSQALQDIKALFPSKSYGMLFSSHGTGWIPADYPTSGENHDYLTPLVLSSQDPTHNHSVSSIGSYFNKSSSNNISLNISELVDSCPFHLKYLVFDACLMSGIEDLWDLKEISDYIVASPTEILSLGMDYNHLIFNLFFEEEPKLETVCRDYMELYRKTNSDATVSLIDCKELEILADAFADIVDAHRDDLYNVNKNKVQKYFRSNGYLFFFYDLRDFVVNLGATEDELKRLDKALETAILFHDETPKFLGLELERCCGMSCYIPTPELPILNEHFRNTNWNKRVKLLEY